MGGERGCWKMASTLACNPWGRWSYPLVYIRNPWHIEVMQSVQALTTRKGKLGFEPGSPCPQSLCSLLFCTTTSYYKKSGKMAGKRAPEHNTTPTPSLLYVLFQSFSVSKGFSFFFTYEITLKLDADVRIPGDPPAIWTPSIWKRLGSGVPVWIWG